MFQDFSAQFESIDLQRRGEQMWVTLNRPETRNAMSAQMVEELEKFTRRVRDDRSIRTVVLRGAGEHFCAGGDLNEMLQLASQAGDPAQARMTVTLRSRSFGRLLEEIDTLPQAVIAVVHGAVLGGGLGLACVADVTLADPNVKFRLPETSLGVPPAQIMPFVLRRVGPSHARRLAVVGGAFEAAQALEMGLVHEVASDARPLHLLTAETIERVRRCAPGALAATKRLVRVGQERTLAEALDEGAEVFADAVASAEGREGLAAFAQKRLANWSRDRKQTLS